MKWIFLTLMFANLAYFGYHWGQSGDSVAVTSSTHPEASSAGGVLLLSERDGQSSRQLEAARVLQNPVVEVTTPEEAPQQESPPEASPKASPLEAETITESTFENVVESAAEVESPLPDSAPVDVCWRLGAFGDLALAQDTAERLTAVDVEVEIKAIDAPTGDFDYRVVIPPMPSMQEAFRRLRELKSRNIDSYVMTQGGNARGISLGLFSTEAAALRHQQSMSAAGYESEILSIARISRGYWLETSSGVIPDNMLAEIRSSLENPELSESACLN